jgi:outer membrane protein, heavy metal efflux system
VVHLQRSSHEAQSNGSGWCCTLGRGAARVAVAVVLACACGRANAARAAEPEPLTLDQTVEVALERSPRIRSALAARETASAYQTFSHMPRAGNPTVNLRALIGRPDDPAATYGVVLGVPFDVSGRRRAWRGESRRILEESDALLRAARNDVRAEAREAYARTVVAERARALAEESAATARELYERVKARLAANAATALDLTLSETQYAETQADLQRARRTLIEAQNGLRQVLDLPPEVPLAVGTLEPPTLPAGLSPEQAIARALASRQELSAWSSVRARWQAADARLRAESIGPMSAAFEAERQGNRSPNTSVGASVGFELPFVQRNQGERAVARGQAAAAGTERELLEHTIAREVATAYGRLDAALAELKALDDSAIPAAERTLSMVRTLLDSGAVDYFRLLSARSGAFALRSRRIEALREAWMSRIALERAIGGTERLQ